MKEMQTIRCEDCNKKLGRISGQAEIKCPRCGKINEYKN
ncbi:Com family DNA-binding transcriptional regulator [Virgibacillus halodenitrificans]